MDSKRKPFDPDAQVIGQVLCAFLESTSLDQIHPYLQKYGMETPEQDHWYSVHDTLKLFGDITHFDNAMMVLISIGIRIAENAVFPPELVPASLEDFWRMLNDVYYLQHRGYVGELIAAKIGDQRYRITTYSPYPDHFWYGNYYGWMKRFLPPGQAFTLEYDERTPGRDEGGDVTVMYATWAW
jgi:hypothetical protein